MVLFLCGLDVLAVFVVNNFYPSCYYVRLKKSDDDDDDDDDE
jgi:hypothetical protein